MGDGGLVTLRLFKTLSVLKKEFLAFATASKGFLLLLKSGIMRGDKLWDELVSEALGESFCLVYF